MSFKCSLLAFALFCASALVAQDQHRWNFNIGGGPGFPLSTAGDFANAGGHFVVGGGPNFGPRFGVNGEFMWHELPIKRSILNQIQVPDGSGRQYSLTFQRHASAAILRPNGRLLYRWNRLVSPVRRTHRSDDRAWNGVSPVLDLVGSLRERALSRECRISLLEQ